MHSLLPNKMLLVAGKVAEHRGRARPRRTVAGGTSAIDV